MISPQDIETESFRIIRSAVGALGMDPATRAVVFRMIHASGDLDLPRLVNIHPAGIQAGIESIRSRRPLVVDVQMLAAGVRGRAKKMGIEVCCAVDDPTVAHLAVTRRQTRAMTAMEVLADKWEGAVVGIGNAPTALSHLLEIIEGTGKRPALVVGCPVGFVGAAEAKEALSATSIPHITIRGTKGGSALAAAAINALLILAAEEMQ